MTEHEKSLYEAAEHLAQQHNYSNYEDYIREVLLIYEDLVLAEREKENEI